VFLRDPDGSCGSSDDINGVVDHAPCDRCLQRRALGVVSRTWSRPELAGMTSGPAHLASLGIRASYGLR
jgi:hypothetical protein